MLTYILALAVGLGSIGIYLTAFFLPEVHRKSDFYWSGIGLFYALVLWVCAGRITGGVLLGQIAGVALLGWFGWQTLTLRRQLTPVERQTELPSQAEAVETVRSTAVSLKDGIQSTVSNFSVPPGISQLPGRILGSLAKAKDQIGQRKSQPAAKTAPKPVTPKPPVKPPTVTVVETPIEVKEVSAPPVQAVSPDSPPIGKATPVEEPVLEVEPTPATELFGLGKPKTDPNPPSLVVESASSAELKRPNLPDPEIVEAAVEDAIAKNLPADPPTSAET